MYTRSLSMTEDTSAMSNTPVPCKTLDAALRTHCNDTISSPSPSSAEPLRSPMTPADLQTLKKILNNTHSPSSPASLATHSRDESLVSTTPSEDRSSESGIEDQVQYTEKHFDYGDERDEGYEDEDGSMELSDENLAAYEAEGSVLLDDEERGYVWSDGDTIEDMMNTPGQIAPPPRPQHIDGVYQNDASSPCDTKKMKLQRAAIEELVKQERLDQEHQEASAVEDENTYFDLSTVEGLNDTSGLSDDTEPRAWQTAQAQTGLSRIEEADEREFELEYFERNERRTSRCFSPAPISRRASEDCLPVSSLQDMLERPAVVATPSGHHLAFTPTSTIPTTPFTKTLNYFKQFKGKENSPSRSRRNASLPEEIAELAREANEEEDLEKYRELDLAPMEPIMGSSHAGDLITFGTPVKSNMTILQTNPASPTRVIHHATSAQGSGLGLDFDLTMTSVTAIKDAVVNGIVAERLEEQSIEPSDLPPCFPAEQEMKDAGFEILDGTPSSDSEKRCLYSEAPTFITVVAMLPEVMFWSTAAPLLKYGSMAYETMVSAFTNTES